MQTSGFGSHKARRLMIESSSSSDRDKALAKLSQRQIDCLRRVAELKKTEQIAEDLGISPSTVNTHIERAMTILGAPSRREAARMVAAMPLDAPSGRSAPTPALPADLVPEKSPTEFSRLFEPVGDLPLPAVAVPELPRRNRLDPLQRMGVALLSLILLCLAIAGLGAAIEQLSAWRSSLAPSGINHSGRR
ncbi:helix-turn-helix domain-containing protein [Sphingomonas beigongshangi]|uniref:helix-turn-helix domain-containing protein n=1 Tax=Sphingomonas beigongshangi TaxID=2782540 RepID=UPI001AEE8F9E|nr:helix-turn-helix transcriptional regulator [Sphingomonas beigongshangi]